MEKNINDNGISFGGLKNSGGGSNEEINIYIDTPPPEIPPPEIVVIERPVYVPESLYVPAGEEVKGREAVLASNGEGIIPPSEYSKAAMAYDYNADFVYEVYTQPLRVSDIRLEAGEEAQEAPFISDSERWLLGAGVSYEGGTAVQHIYVKPVEVSLEASLIINTDRRVYHIILKSFKDVYMPMVRWKYPVPVLPNNYITPIGEGSREGSNGEEGIRVDPRFISVNYRIRYGIFRKPVWLPALVYDDGEKTYIAFPKDVLQASLPAVFDDRSNVVNYRVVEHVLVLDKLIEKITLKLEGREIIIEKKRGE